MKISRWGRHPTRHGDQHRAQLIEEEYRRSVPTSPRKIDSGVWSDGQVCCVQHIGKTLADERSNSLVLANLPPTGSPAWENIPEKVEAIRRYVARSNIPIEKITIPSNDMLHKIAFAKFATSNVAAAAMRELRKNPTFAWPTSLVRGDATTSPSPIKISRRYTLLEEAMQAAAAEIARKINSNNDDPDPTSERLAIVTGRTKTVFMNAVPMRYPHGPSKKGSSRY